MRLFCLDDDPTKYSAANDANIVTTKAVIEPASEEDRTVPEESADPDSKVNSGLSNSTTADNPLADDDDEEDDRVLFNADVVCSAHGEKHKHYSLLYFVTVLLIFGSYVHYIVVIVYVYNVPTHTHTRLTALCPGLPGSAGTRKVKPIWILLKQETVSGSGISWAICKSAPSSRHITTPAPHHSVFTGRMPFLSPNQQWQSTEDKYDTIIIEANH